MDALVCVSDFELVARQKLPTAFWDFFASGADDERALKRNVAAFSRFVNGKLAKTLLRTDC
jgi:(S)-2-hydroxy-acid oxidase